MAKLTAQALEEQYGNVLHAHPLSDCPTPDALRAALCARVPPVEVSLSCLRVWWGKYKLPDGAVTAASAQELESRYGDSIRHLGLEYPTAYKLCKALRQREPPLCVTDAIARVWLSRYARGVEVQNIENAGHLEMLCGDRIRSEAPADLTADALAAWLLKELSVSVRVKSVASQTFFSMQNYLFLKLAPVTPVIFYSYFI